ncbi:MAG: radical SAM protein [Candidatus Omnitrophota bacterium]
MSDIVFIIPGEESEGLNKATQMPSLGVAYLAAMLLKYQFSCKLIDAAITKVSDVEILEIIKHEKPMAIGISANLFNGNSGIRLSKKIKGIFGNIPNVIFGGPFPTSNPAKFLTEGLADAVVLGEGEITLLEIMKNLREKTLGVFQDISGLAYLEKGNVKLTRNRDLKMDLDNLPFPAWRVFPNIKLYKTRSRKLPAIPILTSRGCPFNCIYCSKDVFKSVFRPRSPENIIQEIDYLIREFGVRQLDIMDDNFSLDRSRTDEILDLIIKRKYNLAINLQLGVRADLVDEDLLKKMRQAGVYKIAFGVESGDTRVLRIIKKQLELKQVLKNTLLARKSGMVVYGFFMLGLPGDNSESMKETINFSLKMNPHIANFVITIPFPGTKLYDMVKSNGRFYINTSEGLSTGFYGNKVFYTIEGMKEKEVLYYYKLAYKMFYCRLSKILDIILSICSFSELKWILHSGISVITPVLRRAA